jgi:glycosyltransferase involved in cell wall biosynthesis
MNGGLLIIVPAWNEEGAIEGVVRSVRNTLPDTPILVVDDHSADSTASIAERAGASVLRLPIHLGLGGCVQAAYKLAFELGYEYVIRVDGDGQHPPEEIPNIYDALVKTGYEVVIGSRFVNEHHAHTSVARSVGIKFFRAILKPILGKPIHDPTSGFVGVNRRALQVFSRTFPLAWPEIEALVVLQRRRFRFCEVPCTMKARVSGRSSITFFRSFQYMLHVLLGVFVNVLKVDPAARRPRSN